QVSGAGSVPVRATRKGRRRKDRRRDGPDGQAPDLHARNRAQPAAFSARAVPATAAAAAAAATIPRREGARRSLSACAARPSKLAETARSPKRPNYLGASVGSASSGIRQSSARISRASWAAAGISSFLLTVRWGLNEEMIARRVILQFSVLKSSSSI